MDDSSTFYSPSSLPTPAGDLADSLPFSHMEASTVSPIELAHHHVDGSSSLTRKGTSLHNNGISHVLDPFHPCDIPTTHMVTLPSYAPLSISSAAAFPVLPGPSSCGSSDDGFGIDTDITEIKRGLLQLPLELLDMILHHILGCSAEDRNYSRRSRRCRRKLSRNSRRELSRVSLVCREWSRIVRPRLFLRLVLKSRDDIHFLVNMLYHPQNRWLSVAITELELHHPHTIPGNMGLEHVLALLSRKLPSLREFHHYSSTGVPESLSPRLQLPLQRYRDLRILFLQNIKVSSFSLLIKLLRNIPELENLTCLDVKWIHQDRLERPPARMPRFLHLYKITVKCGETGSAPWTFLWLFYPMIVRRCAPSNTDIVNHDIMLLSMLAEAMINQELSSSLLFEYDSAQNELSVRNLDKYLRYAVTLWRTATVNSNSVCSAIRNVTLSLGGNKYVSDHGTEWEAVDAMFAQKADNLQAFNVIIKYGTGDVNVETSLSQVQSHFPRLYEHGRMSVTFERWRCTGDGSWPSLSTHREGWLQRSLEWMKQMTRVVL